MVMFKLVILICAIGAPGEDCTVRSAADVIRPVDRYATPIACLMDVETKLAGINLGGDPALYRVKALCPRAFAVDVGSKN